MKQNTSQKPKKTPQEASLNIPQEAFDWYDEYAHGDIDRRTFLTRLASLSVAGLTVSAIGGALIPDYAKAEQVSFNDPAIKATYEVFSSPKGHGEGGGYLVQPTRLPESGVAPCVLVVHENRGLNPYIKDVARRLAMQGYVAFAPDALFPLGGYPGNDDDGRAMQKSLDKDKIEQDLVAAALWLKEHEKTTGKLGVVGFCFGGYIANFLAASIPDKVDAAVPFYGTPAKQPLVDQVKGPLLIHFAENDKRVNATWEEYKVVLEKNAAEYEAFTYAKAQHGFHNDSTSRYSPKDAELAWRRTVDFFDSHLK